MDTIVIDDLPYNSNIIDLEEDNSDLEVVSEAPKNQCHDPYAGIRKENKLLFDFIERCLEMENSCGMQRVIDRSLIPIYEKASEEFRKSRACESIISKAICNLEKTPYLKFSHVKQLCDSLRYNLKKNSFQYAYKVPASIRIKDNPNGEKRKIVHNRTKHPVKKIKKRKVPEIILSDDSDGYEVPIINNDDNDHRIVEKSIPVQEWDRGRNDLRKISKEIVNMKEPVPIVGSIPVEYVLDEDAPENFTNNVKSIPDNKKICDPYDEVSIIETPVEHMQIDDEKENEIGNIKFVQNAGNLDHLTVDKTNDYIPTVCLSDEEEIQNTDMNGTVTDLYDPEKLLVPRKEEAYSGYDELMIQNKIKSIEETINRYKTIIDDLEQQEVNVDSMDSPYLRCERFKSKIVDLYKELCKLTGEKPVKRREVRLKAVDERSELPMKKLEEFINSNIGKDGLPHFPDFCDVVQCVYDANISGNLGWSKQVVMREARALFTFCGQALQKSRQRREWRDLLSRVKRGALADPADSDPALMARLQANRKHGYTRENELLERYSEMERRVVVPDHYSDDSYAKPRHRDELNNRVRIAPTPVQFVPVLHKVTKIVTRCNQVVEIVVSDNKSSNNKIVNIVEEKTETITTTVSKNVEVTPPTEHTMSSRTEISEKSASNTDDASGLSILSTFSIPLRQAERKKVQIENREEETHNMIKEVVKTPNEEPESLTEISACSISLLQGLVGNVSTDEPSTISESILNIPNDTNTRHSDTETNTDDSEDPVHIIEVPDDMKLEDLCQPNNENIPNGSCSLLIKSEIIEKEPLIVVKKELDQQNNNNIENFHESESCCEQSIAQENIKLETVIERTKNADQGDSNNSETVNMNNNLRQQTDYLETAERELPTETSQEKVACDDSNNDETDKTCNTDNDASVNILAHFLKARVVVPRMTIKFESASSSDSNKVLDYQPTHSNTADDCRAVEKNDESIQTDVFGVQIKEEPCVDIQGELDELGDNFTTTIIDIQDPFLVVEISSDSGSDDEDED